MQNAAKGCREKLFEVAAGVLKVDPADLDASNRMIFVKNDPEPVLYPDSKNKPLEKLEKEIGKPLLSFSCKDIKPALVEQETLDKIQALEKSLSLSLVAVDN